MVDSREQLQAMRVERLSQPRLDLVGVAVGLAPIPHGYAG
jgi:hypothetical protein